jgi:hypothetical protein
MVKLPDSLIRAQRDGTPYLRISDLQIGETFEIVNEGEYRDLMGKEVFQIKVIREKNKEEYWLTLGTIALRRLATELGTETSEWIGEKIEYTQQKIKTRYGTREVAVFLPVKQNE